MRLLIPRAPRIPAFSVALIALSIPGTAHAQPAPAAAMDSATVAAFADSLFARELAALGVPGAVVAVVKDGRLLYAAGYGHADRERRTPVDPHRTVFRVASVTKPLTALAVMQLAERGLVDLHAPAERYLGGLRLPRGPGRPVTVADLLTHTAGLDVRVNGTVAASDAAVRPLDAYLRATLPPRVRPAGQVLAYSNHGYALLGRVVEITSGLEFGEYVRHHVFAPLGMRHSSLRLSGEAAASAATGYEPRARGYRRSAVLHPHIVPAAGLNATAADMGRLMAALLEGGPVLGQPALREMRRRQFGQHPAMPGITYGLYESYENSRRTLFHVGGLRGFISGMYLWPDEGVGLFVSNNGYHPDVVRDVAFAFMDRFLPGAVPPAAPPAAPGDVRRFAGHYRLAGQARSNVEKAGGLRGVGELILSANDDGTLGAFGIRFAPVAPGVFRDAAGDETIGFQEEGGRAVRAVTTDLFSATQVWERLAWWETAATGQAFLALAVLLFAAGLALPPRPADVRGVLRASSAARPAGEVWAARALAAACALYLLFAVLGVMGFRTMGETGMLVRVPPLVDAALVAATAGALVSLALPVVAVLAVRRRWWTGAGRMRFVALSVLALAFAAFLDYWNLLGIRH